MVFALRFRNFRHIPTLNVTCIRSSIQNLSGTNSARNEDANSSDVKEDKKPPQAPTNCCMSNCPNCVWIEYADSLSNYYKDGGEKAVNEIHECITDPNVKAYVLMEIRIRKKFG